MIEVSVIILSFNTRQYLDNCLRSVFNNIDSKTEIIVFDNGSSDGSAGMVARKYPKARLIKNSNNLGFSAGNNLAAKSARGRYLFFLNSDIIWESGNVSKLKQLMTEDVGAVSPLLLNENKSIQADPCYLRFPSAIRSLIYYNRPIKNLVVKLFPRLLFSNVDKDEVFFSEQLPGAALMVKKDLFEKIGGFDENLPIYFNDTDISWRIARENLKLLVNPAVKIVHYGRKSIAPLIEKEGIEFFYLLNFRSLFDFCVKNYSVVKTLSIKIAIFINLAIRFKIGLIRKLFSSVMLN